MKNMNSHEPMFYCKLKIIQAVKGAAVSPYSKLTLFHGSKENSIFVDSRCETSVILQKTMNMIGHTSMFYEGITILHALKSATSLSLQSALTGKMTSDVHFLLY